MRPSALVLAAACFAGSASLAAAAAHADDLPALARDIWAWRAVGQPINADDIPRIERPAGWAPDWSAAAVAARRQALAGFEARWHALADAGRPVAAQVDYRLLGSVLARVHWELDAVRLWRRDPGFYVAQTLGALVDALLPPPPFSPPRGRDVLARLAAFPRVLADGRANLDRIVPPFAQLALDNLQDVGPRLRQAMTALAPLLDAESRGRLDGATETAVAALASYRAWLASTSTPGATSTPPTPSTPSAPSTTSTPSRPSDIAVGRDAYLFYLHKVALLPFTPEQILAMGRQEWARTVAAEALESRRNRGVAELPIFATQQAQIDRARVDEVAIRGYLDQKGILTVPAWMPPYAYRAMPAYLDPLADFGEGTNFPFTPQPGQESTRYVPRPSPRLGYFALSMARDPRADMVHEGIPGHGFQLALSRRHEDPIRRHWYDSGANEGLGFYAEEMMLQMGLFDDSPKTREMIWNYARLRALRVEVDVRLALGTFTIDQAADYLRTAVPMDAATAHAEAASFAVAPGFAIGYQIGKLQIVKLLAEARRRQGDAFDLRAFDDFVWRNGNVPLALQAWELLGLRDDLAILDGD